MSNHAGGELLNDVLHLLQRESIFQMLGLEKTQALLIEITSLAQDEHDCNAGEVLDEIGVRHQLCYCCLKPAREFLHGLCRECNPDDFDHPDFASARITSGREVLDVERYESS